MSNFKSDEVYIGLVFKFQGSSYKVVAFPTNVTVYAVGTSDSTRSIRIPRDRLKKP